MKVGPSAGVTKMVHQKVKICESPKIYLFDTPGILQPRIPHSDIGMKLAACGTGLCIAHISPMNSGLQPFFNVRRKSSGCSSGHGQHRGLHIISNESQRSV